MMTGKKLAGEKLRDLREKRTLSLFDVSVKCGVNPSTLSKIEGDKVKNVRFSTIRKVAHAFDMTPEAFLKEVEIVTQN